MEEALVLFQKLGDTWNQARSLANLTRVFAAQGEYNRARTIGEQGLRLSRTLGNKGRIAIALGELARVHFLAQDDFAQTQALAEQSLALFRELGDAQYIAYLLSLQGEIRLILQPHLSSEAGCSPFDMKLFGPGLMASAPARPREHSLRRRRSLPYQPRSRSRRTSGTVKGRS